LQGCDDYISKVEDGQLNLNLENFNILGILSTVAKEFEHPAKAEDKEIVVAASAAARSRFVEFLKTKLSGFR